MCFNLDRAQPDGLLESAPLGPLRVQVNEGDGWKVVKIIAASGTQSWGFLGREVTKELVVVLPVSFHLEHDLVVICVSAELVPVLVSLKPR